MQRPTRAMRRLGSTSSGRRISKARSVERQMVPKRVLVEWLNAACTTCREVGAGTVRRWKYHWLTVAAVVARWMPAPIASVQR